MAGKGRLSFELAGSILEKSRNKTAVTPASIMTRINGTTGRRRRQGGPFENVSLRRHSMRRLPSEALDENRRFTILLLSSTLRREIPSSDTLVCIDINAQTTIPSSVAQKEIFK